MHPVLTVLHWEGVTRPIGSYGALLVLALVLGSALTVRAAIRGGYDEGAIISALAGAIGLGFLGAYLAATLVTWLQTGSLRGAAIMFYGGAAAGTLAYARLAAHFGVPAGSALDLALPGFPIAHALGRIGCLLGGCCYGAPSELPWAIVYTHPLAAAAVSDQPRHPWPLYEACCLLVLAAIFARPPRRALAPGTRAARYVLAYAAVRCSLEPLRGDALRGVFCGGLVSAGQLCALASALIALGFLWLHRPALCASGEAV